MAYQAAANQVDKNEAKLAQAPLTVSGLIQAGKAISRDNTQSPPQGFREVGKGTKHARTVASLGKEQRKLQLTTEQLALQRRMKKDEVRGSLLASALKDEKKREAFVLERLQAEVKIRKVDETYEHKVNANLRARLTKLELAKDYGQVNKQAHDFKEVEAKLSTKKKQGHRIAKKNSKQAAATTAAKKQVDNNFNDLIVPGINGKKEDYT